MAHTRRSLTKLNESIKAWRQFEAALQKLDSFEECAKWVLNNPKIAEKLSGAGLMAVMADDLKRKA